MKTEEKNIKIDHISFLKVFQSAYYSPLTMPTSGCPSCSMGQAPLVSRPIFYPQMVYYPGAF